MNGEMMWIPKEIVKKTQEDPIRVYLLLKMMAVKILDQESEIEFGQEEVDQFILDMIEEVKKQYPTYQKVEDLKEKELN